MLQSMKCEDGLTCFAEHLHRFAVVGCSSKLCKEVNVAFSTNRTFHSISFRSVFQHSKSHSEIKFDMV